MGKEGKGKTQNSEQDVKVTLEHNDIYSMV